MNAFFTCKEDSFAHHTRPIAISEIYVASEQLFLAFCRKPLEDFHFIGHFKDRMYEKDSVKHCLLLLGENHPDGVLIEAEGYDYARYTSYLPGGAYMWNGLVQQIAQDILHDCQEKTYTILPYEHLAKDYGLKLEAGTNGIQVLADALFEISGISAVEVRDGSLRLMAHEELQVLAEADAQDIALTDSQTQWV